jgi:hypothetical protein
MAMGLPPVTSAAFLVSSNFGKMWVSRRNILDVSATPSGIKREFTIMASLTMRSFIYGWLVRLISGFIDIYLDGPFGVVVGIFAY